MSGPLARIRHLEPWSPWLYALLALVPLVVCWEDVSDLFWFGDDWDLLDQLWRQGFWQWATTPFGENYTPVFKTIWSTAVHGGRGSYLVMMLLNWVTHALNVGLFALWLRRSGFDWFTTAIPALGLGLTVATIEAVAWSTQFSMLLAQLFFFTAVLYHEHVTRSEGWSNPRLLVLAGLVAASALSFSRGVLTGTTIAGGMLLARLPRSSLARPSWGLVARVGLVALLPSVVVALAIARYTGGNQEKLWSSESVLEPAFWFGVYYWMVVPLYGLLELESWGWRTVTLLGLAEGAMIAGGWCAASTVQRRVLGMLLLLDLGTAALLGLGRYHAGLFSTRTSRYHYVALICTLPFAALCLRATLAALRLRGGVRTCAAVAVAGLFGWMLARSWPQEMDSWAKWRGRYTRYIVLRAMDPPARGAIPGIPFLTTERAKQLIDRYHLH